MSSWESTEFVKCHSYHIISSVHAIEWLITEDIELDHMAEVVFVKFLHCKVTSPFPYYTI